MLEIFEPLYRDVQCVMEGHLCVMVWLDQTIPWLLSSYRRASVNLQFSKHLACGIIPIRIGEWKKNDDDGNLNR